MITNEQARTRVARGAAHLDAVRPGWFNRIDVGTLTLRDPCNCIVGQLCRTDEESFYPGVLSFGIALPPHETNQFGAQPQRNRIVAEYGFDLLYSEYDDYTNTSAKFRPLQDAWIEAIADRRLSQETEPQKTDVAVGLSLTEPVAVSARH